MSQHLPCVGIRDHQGTLVCWCMTLPYGAIGTLQQTAEGHTGQELARVALRAVIDRWMSHSAGCLPFVYLNSDHDDVSAMKLFVSLGFTRVADHTHSSCCFSSDK